VFDVGSSGNGVIESRSTLDGLPGLVWPKCTASQRWQVCLVWIKQGDSATLNSIQVLVHPLLLTYQLLWDSESRFVGFVGKMKEETTPKERNLKNMHHQSCFGSTYMPSSSAT